MNNAMKHKEKWLRCRAMILVLLMLSLLILAKSPPVYADDETKEEASSMVVNTEDNQDIYIEEDTENSDASNDGTWTNQTSDVEVLPSNPNNGTIVFVVASMPEEALNRTVRASVAYGPADETLTSTKLNGTNGFVSSVELEPREYFCSYGVTNDPSMDYPVSARDDMYYINVAAGSCTVVYLDVSGESLFEQITNKLRYYDKEPVEPAEDGVNINNKAQIGCYLTVPDNFGDTVVAYIENLNTGKVTELNLYKSNQYTAYNTNVTEGKYKVVGTRVLADGDNRFTVVSEQETITVNNSVTADFHLTVNDANYPDASMVTPSRDNNAVVKEAERINSGDTTETVATPEPQPSETPTEEPVIESKPSINIGAIIAVLLIGCVTVVCAIGCYLWYKNQNEEG